MTQNVDCERARLELMAALDGETRERATDAVFDVRQHLASCSECDRWLKDFEALNRQFQGVVYGRHEDLWHVLEPRLRRSAMRTPVMRRMWLIGAFVLGWRALQLLIDLPYPLLQLVVPLAAAVAALWLLARDPLAIETFAPELQKRGA